MVVTSQERMRTTGCSTRSPSQSFSGQQRIIPARIFHLRDFFQLWITSDQRLRRRNILPAQQMLELQSVHRCFGLEMIISDYIGRFGFARDYLIFLFPFLQLRRLVQIVVTVVSIVAVEPLIVVAAM